MAEKRSYVQNGNGEAGAENERAWDTGTSGRRITFLQL